MTVRINVAPTAIRLTGTGDTTNAVGNLSKDGKKPTALTVTDDTNDPADAGTEDDMLTYVDDTEYSSAEVATIDVMDQNLTTDLFGIHKVILTGRGADQFEVVETTEDETDGSTWEIRLIDDAKFDFEKLVNAKEKAAKDKSITLTITVTATDKDGADDGLDTVGYFSIVVKDEDTRDDPETPETPETETPDAPDQDVPGLEDDADDSDEDGPVIPIPPPDGGAFLDDLLDEFVITIDDIDIA